MKSSSLPDFTTDFEIFQTRYSWTLFSDALELTIKRSTLALGRTTIPIKLNFIETFGTDSSTFFFLRSNKCLRNSLGVDFSWDPSSTVQTRSCYITQNASIDPS